MEWARTLAYITGTVDQQLLLWKPRYTFDRDERSLILPTVADALGLPASLAEITLPGGSGDNFVRWQIDEKTIVDWDANGSAQRTMPLPIRASKERLCLMSKPCHIFCSCGS
jgi:hypothetical protein